MRKVLLVGEHPYGYSGNSYMMRGVLEQIDKSEWEVAVLTENKGTQANVFTHQSTQPAIITPDSIEDRYGQQKIKEILSSPYTPTFDVLLMVGVDLWHYKDIWQDIAQARITKGFKWAAIFPYDLPEIRPDWVRMINALDFPCVYSEFGEEILKPYIPNISYYRPHLYQSELFRPVSDEERITIRRTHLGESFDNKFIFGFNGNNQFRKDPQRLILSFFQFKKIVQNPDRYTLYLHTNITEGVFNIAQFVSDCGGKDGDVVVKNQTHFYTREQIAEIYQLIDAYVICSLQEGLSWTVLEAQLSGCPVIASYTTSHMELIKEGCGRAVYPKELSFIPIIANSGVTYVKAQAVSISDLSWAMVDVATGPLRKEELSKKGRQSAEEWVKGESNVNDLLRKCVENKPEIAVKKNAILFMQHSAAGDVYMTTRCLKDLRRRHDDCELHYMTQVRFHDILKNNPYIDKLFDWDETGTVKEEYRFVYNVHQDVILPGHWGRNCNSILSDFYWKLLNIEPTSPFIDLKEPEDEIESAGGKVYFLKNTLKDPAFLKNHPIAIVHTTGGDHIFRTYKYMGDVVDGLHSIGYFVIQVGGIKDYPARGADIDFRGVLTYRETAWVISKAVLAITVDSFISHLCGGLGVNQVCLFGSGNENVVAPLQVEGKLKTLSPDYVKDCKGLGPCSGSVRDCPLPCTGRHTPESILSSVLEIEGLKGNITSVQVKAEKEIVVAANFLNEEDQLEEWFACVRKFTDKIVIVDTGSKDRTKEIAEKYGAIVIVDDIIRREGYGAARNQLRALSLQHFKSAHWCLILDADERIAEEDLHALRFTADYLIPKYDAVALPRIDWKDKEMTAPAKDVFIYPDFQCRMTRLKSPMQYVRRLHEQASNCTIYANLNGPKIHHFHRSSPESKRIEVGKVCSHLHGKDELGHTYPNHPKEKIYKDLLEKEGW